ncbi:MAG TPA: hypothetical protein VHV51_05405 [Polyangiaceae bacterium]|jgi:hypothetical protein|nr:hypothetical protein [Polyangiaceae bacterium]
MTTRFTSLLALAALTGSALMFSSHAYAADPDADAAKPDGDETPPEAAKPDAPAGEAGGPDDPEKQKNAKLAADTDADSSPVELPGKTYRAVGLRYRAVIVPKFMMNLFGDGGATVVANGFGPEFTIRKDGFEYDFSLWYASYAMDPTPFKASSDGAEAWEIVQSHLKVLYITSDFLWSHEIASEFSVNYGLGAGLGFVFGDLNRTQAYPGSGANSSTGAGFLPCAGPGNAPANPSAGGQYCGNDNNHYNGYAEPSWANGGSKPIVFPWLALQTGLRWKPHRNFIARLDAGFGTSGFFLGLGADYGL